MKNFFYVVFGGLGAILFGIFSVHAGNFLLETAGPFAAKWGASSFTSLASAVMSQPTDGTSISGMMRKIRYSAGEEEDLVNNAYISFGSKSPDITSVAYLVRNLTSGKVVAAYNEEKLLPIASLSKLVTAVVATKVIEPDVRIVISNNIISTYGNTADFRVGETFRAEDLYYPLLMVSSNEAAEAFAESYGRAEFIAAMNEFVQSIGAYRTYFADPSGLSPQNMSTAADLAIILDWVRENNPELIAITKLKSKIVRSHVWTNPTHFLSWSNYLGGKNGFTDEANRTGAVLFSMGHEKDVYAVIILGSSARDADVVKLLALVR